LVVNYRRFGTDSLSLNVGNYQPLLPNILTLTEVLLKQTEFFLTLTEVFFFFFLSCKANTRVKLAKTGHRPHSSTLVVICVVQLLFVLFYVLFVCKCVLPPSDNPIAVTKYIKNEDLSLRWKPKIRHLPFYAETRMLYPPPP
jgi:hypothetical protein